MGDRLGDKIAIVTGFGKGIGREIALRYATEGATVIGTEIDEELTDEVVATAQMRGLNVRGVAPADMFDEAAVNKAINDVGEEFGRIDILVANACGVVMVPLEEMSVEQFNYTLNGECTSAFMAAKAAFPYMKDNGGSIITFASASAHRGIVGLPVIAHASGKGAVLAMTRQLSLEGGPHNIRANSISPGFILTPSTRPSIEEIPEFADKIKSGLSISRLGEAADIANGAVFLASDEANYITGIDLKIDGGMMVR